MNTDKIFLASLGLGWWSDVLADAVQRAPGVEIVTCFSRSEEKRVNFAKKYGCEAANSYEEILANPAVHGIINTTPNNIHLETTRLAAAAGKHIFLDKPIANTVAEGFEIADIGVVGKCDSSDNGKNHFGSQSFRIVRYLWFSNRSHRIDSSRTRTEFGYGRL